MNNYKSKKYKKLTVFALLILVAGVYSACTKQDDFKKFVAGGEISYTGKLDSVKMYSGDSRVVLKGLFLADPKVVSCKIFWNNKKDSIVIPVVKKNIVDTLNYSIPISTEGLQNFTIYTYDKAGNKSIPVYANARSYGDRYKASLSNRGISTAVKGTDGNATIQWLGMDKLTGVFTTELQYTNSSNTLVTVRTPIDSTKTILKNYKSGSTFKYRTLFLPDTNCVDTFRVAYSANLSVDEDMTSLLSNTGPFTRAAYDGSRWGTLAGWTTSSGAKNINNNQYGGYELRSGVGVLSFESGWGINTPVTNGLIYQTITLPAGRYTFRLSGIDQNSGGSRYIAVAAGNTLPNVTDIPAAAIAYANIADGELNFSLTQQTTVSIGFGVSIDNSGQYIKVKSVKLLKWAK
ncbi:DUF5013 domain-containing protein [Pedobacter riviphilus]|uniref:DUF5013 domain-containing protein n=1 Tax=Pedobacter riviphilus TaxID=2766984 RepID=A0ABX6TDA6_9SPHI|nr:MULTISPECIES: DUF4998 domain-containing protein [Pedobacter]NII85210.1 hypothetical protein [Pedobacter sp. SG908]NMN39876.1 hypothetical protein [Pedobacter sp. SG918]QNR83166.1 DUF5013 domain-containing protein [Pedobacter riviphilus]